jgi:TetR/AcrR family transcriptional regulator, lmrAB and yxaGH operons repressor
VVRDRDSGTELVLTMARLLREQGYTATGLAQVLAESGISNGSLYHHFPGGLEELAEAALEASAQSVADALNGSLESAPNTALAVVRFLEIAKGPVAGSDCPGCPVAPTALESPILSPRLREAAARCFDRWEGLIAARLRAERWPEDSVDQTASAALALVEGALLLSRVTGQVTHLENAQGAALSLLGAPAAGDDSGTRA